MIKKISRRSFLQACSVAAATAALTACGGKAESKTADAHEAVTFMAPYKEIEAFIEQVHSVYPEVNIEVVPYSGDNTTTCLQNMFAAGDLPDVCTLTYYDPQIDLGVVVGQGADVRQVACRKHILQAGGGVIAAVWHDLDVHFRVNAVHLLNKGFYLLIRCHKGDGFVRICCFAFSLAAAGGQRCRGSCNAASLQKGAAGDLFYHINILSSHFRKAVLRKCRSAVLP